MGDITIAEIIIRGSDLRTPGSPIQVPKDATMQMLAHGTEDRLGHLHY